MLLSAVRCEAWRPTHEAKGQGHGDQRRGQGAAQVCPPPLVRYCVQATNGGVPQTGTSPLLVLPRDA